MRCWDGGAHTRRFTYRDVERVHVVVDVSQQLQASDYDIVRSRQLRAMSRLKQIKWQQYSEDGVDNGSIKTDSSVLLAVGLVQPVITDQLNREILWCTDLARARISVP